MFLIKRLWVSVMENRDAYGYSPIGVVSTKDEAERICGLEFVPKSEYPWPLASAYELKGDSVPRFRAEEMHDLSGMTLEELKAL